jgi:hypothetical protein
LRSALSAPGIQDEFQFVKEAELLPLDPGVFLSEVTISTLEGSIPYAAEQWAARSDSETLPVEAAEVVISTPPSAVCVIFSVLNRETLGSISCLSSMKKILSLYRGLCKHNQKGAVAVAIKCS